jgi:hypothetical protein
MRRRLPSSQLSETRMRHLFPHMTWFSNRGCNDNDANVIVRLPHNGGSYCASAPSDALFASWKCEIVYPHVDVTFFNLGKDCPSGTLGGILDTTQTVTANQCINRPTGPLGAIIGIWGSVRADIAKTSPVPAAPPGTKCELVLYASRNCYLEDAYDPRELGVCSDEKEVKHVESYMLRCRPGE